MSFLKK